MSPSKPDPYRDLGEVYQEETSTAKIPVQVTPRTPTELAEREDE